MSKLRKYSWMVSGVLGVMLFTFGLVDQVAYARSGGSACEGQATEAAGPPPQQQAIHGCASACPPGISGQCLKRNIGALTWPNGQVTAENYICVCVEQATIVNPDGTTSTIEVAQHWDKIGEWPVCDVFSFSIPTVNMVCAGACPGNGVCKKDPQTPHPITNAVRFKCSCP